MAWVTPTSVATGDVLTASTWNQDVVANSIALPRGIMGYAQATANQAGITTVVDLTGISVTFTAQSTRYYRTTFYTFSVVQATSNSFPEIRITDGSNVQKQSGVFLLSAGSQAPYSISVVETGLSGSVTRKARATVPAGSMTVAASSTSPMFIVVEDIGAA